MLQDLINVTGTFTAPAYSKVSVNGKAALTAGDRFYVNNIPLSAGTNSLEVLVQAPDGTSQSQTISVTNNSYLIPDYNKFYVGIAPDNGMAPLATKIQVIPNSTDPITQITVDFDGDGTPDVTTTDPEQLLYTYDQPGEYTASIQIETASSTETHQQYVVVYGPGQMDAYLRGIYYTVLDQLTAGNITNAMYFLTPTMQDKYQAAVTTLQSIIPQLGYVVGGTVSGDVAELSVIRNEAGNDRVYSISLVRGRDGYWRIGDM